MNLDDLGTAPLNDSPTDLAAEAREAADFMDYLTNLADDGPTSFAADTLLSMRETIRSTQRVTPGQRQAVRNIVRGAREAEETRERNTRSRRYEGFGR